MGMCFGVRAAIKTAMELPDPQTTAIHGNLVHNQHVREALQARGFETRHETEREILSDRPAVLITARDALEDRLSGFQAGADDYLVKPFDMAELLARLRAVLRRTHGASAATGQWSCGALALDERRKAVSCGGTPVALSPTDYSLLLALVQSADRVVTRAELEDHALAGSDSQSLDVHMSNLRKKIGEQRVRTVRGVGYMIAA